VTGYAVLVVVLMFVANVLGQLWSAAAFLRPASVFSYYQPQKLWLRRRLRRPGDAWNASQPLFACRCSPSSSASAGGYLAALRTLTRRDLPAPYKIQVTNHGLRYKQKYPYNPNRLSVE